MPQRKPHRKSRYGCDQCRRRHVKCDENPPRCANCITRDEQCHFSRLAPPAAAVIVDRDSSSAADSEIGTRCPSESCSDWQPTSTRLTELKLMHHWCAHTCSSFGLRNERLCRESVTQEAFRHDYLMAALLALTSIHLASDMVANDASAAHKHVSRALQYQNQALAGLREELKAVTTDNCASIFVTSTLVMICAIVSPLLPAGIDNPKESTVDAVLCLHDHMNAVRSLGKFNPRHSLVQGIISGFMGEQLEQRNAQIDQTMSELRRLNDTTTSPEKHDVFDQAITGLLDASHRYDSIIVWLVHVGPGFLDELRTGANMALAIYMQWGALLDQLEGVWWAKFSGTKLVAELSDVLRERGVEWAQVTSWCREQVGLSDEPAQREYE